MSASDEAEPLRAERVTVGVSRIEMLVRVWPASRLRTTEYPDATETLLEALPGLRRHRCECGTPHGIERELADTELPHLLEHVVLELMVLAGSPRTLSGRTMWDFERDGRGVFRVDVEYDDDLVALGAVREGIALVNAVIENGSSLTVDGVVAELCGLRTTRVD